MTEKIKLPETKVLLLIALCLILAVVSFAGLAPVMESPDTYPHTIESLDNKRSTVVEMSAALIGISVVVAAVPGDATTPVANQISQLNSYLILVLGAIMLEKFLLPIIALVVWRVLIPVAFVLLALFIFFKKNMLRIVAVHLAILSAAMTCMIPCSVRLADLIDESFGTESLMEQIHNDINDMNDRITASVKEEETDEAAASSSSSSSSQKKTTEEKKGILDQLAGVGESLSGVRDTISDLGKNISDLKDDLNKSIQNLGSTFTNAAGEAIEEAKVIMGDLMDAVAILLVTVCVIPIVTLFLLAAMVRFSFMLLLRQFSEF